MVGHVHPVAVPPSDETRTATLLVRAGSVRVPLGFAREDGSIYLIARERSARWPVELLRDGRADLLLAEGPVQGAAELVSDRGERDRILGLFRAKYGPERFSRWYDTPARILRIRLGPPPSGPSGGRYYDWIGAEFDNVAEDYDRHITGNRINRLLRDRSLARLRPLFEGRKRLLEVGCGSGMETLPLLREGHEIVAFDISERMLRVVEGKARAEGLGERLTVVQGAARDLTGRLGTETSGRFDGAYSTYGAMNCESDLRPVRDGLAGVLVPGAPLLLGIYNRWCLTELVGYGMTLQFGRAFGRSRNPVPVGASRFCVDVFAYSAAEIVRLFRPSFVSERMEGVPALLPPSDLAPYAERFSRRFATLARWDAGLGVHWPFNHLGDHFLLTLRRRP
ncbi:MAG TPA: class I SAM-dependent methyltransferase [Thermoplasmata archaeon]|nr:class I SAM-dependent methyltransferase [Thermoplasmata archaeon]